MADRALTPRPVFIAFGDVRMQLLGVAARPGYWRGLASTRRALAEHISDARVARDYDIIAEALERGEPLPESAAAYLLPCVRTVQR